MTAVNTAPLWQRIHDVNPADSMLLAEAAINLAEVVLNIDNDVLRYDYGVAVCDYLDAMGAEGEDPRSNPRPEATPADDLPIVVRLKDHNPRTFHLLSGTLLALNMTQGLISGEDAALGHEFFDVLVKFTSALGIPTEDEYRAHPEFYPHIADPTPVVEKFGFYPQEDVA